MVVLVLVVIFLVVDVVLVLLFVFFVEVVEVLLADTTLPPDEQGKSKSAVEAIFVH